MIELSYFEQTRARLLEDPLPHVRPVDGALDPWRRGDAHRGLDAKPEHVSAPHDRPDQTLCPRRWRPI